MKNKFLLCGLVMMLTACGGFNFTSSSGSSDSKETYVYSEFSDIPIPEDSMMSLEKTEIYGKDADWVGKVVYESPYENLSLFDFFKTELPKYGWVEITSTHGMTPVLVYGRYPRILLIKLESKRWSSGTTVTMTLTPTPKRRDKQRRHGADANNNGNVNQQQSQQGGFTSPDAQKQAPGSLGLGNASNMNYQSNSNGVGAPPRN